MLLGLCRFSMHKSQVTSGTLAPNVEEITPPGAAATLVPLFKRNVFAVQELTEKERGRFEGDRNRGEERLGTARKGPPKVTF